jgi:hypothetical protein
VALDTSEGGTLMTNNELDAAQFQRWIAHDLHAPLGHDGDQKFVEIWLFAEVLESVALELKELLNEI